MPVIATPLPQRVQPDDRPELNRFSSQAGGLIGWWPCGYHEGSIAPDLSGHAHHAIALQDSGGGSSSAPHEGKWIRDGGRRAMSFDPSVQGSSTRVAMTTSGVTPPTNATFCFLIKPTLDTTYSQIPFTLSDVPAGGSNYNLYLATHGIYSRSRMYLAWGGYVSSATDDSYMDWGEWMHIALVRRGSAGDWTGDIYKNGALYTTKTTTTDPPTSGGPYTLFIGGYRIGALGANSGGEWDDVRIYNRALGANEIAAIYWKTKGGGYGDLAAQPTRFHHLSAAAAAVGKGSRTAMFLGVE